MHLKQNLCAILAAFIWGTAFVAQSVSTDFIEPFTFNALRSIIATAFLLIVIFLINKKETISKFKQNKKQLLTGGILAGIILFVAANLQQFGIFEETSAGKAGFITALYIVLVPVFGLFFKRKAPFTVWISVLIATVGLYLLCIKESFTVELGDFYVFLCSIMFAFHILTIDHFVEKCDSLMLSFVQFFTVSILSLIFALIFETPNLNNIMHCIFPVLYVGIFSSGIAYTLQIVAQKGSNPTVITLLLSLESVFAVLAGAIVLKDVMSVKELIGCALMFFSVILAQIKTKS